MKIALVGGGRMSQAIQTLARARGIGLVTVIEGRENRTGEALTQARLGGADVVLEFTRPAVVVNNLTRLAQLGAHVVTGTTGWQEQLPEVTAAFAAGGGALLHASNFSVGVQLFLRGAERLAAEFRGRAEFEGYIVEAHHRHKADAPSGTAARLQDAARKGDPGREFPISSIRAGAIAGVHALTFDTPGETITLEHTAHNRECFAVGALAAAEWIRGRSGVYRFDEMLFGAGR